jgi:hypothetical protein
MPDLWRLVWGRPFIDPRALAEALEQTACRDDLDFRTRLLVRDSADALEGYWGREQWQAWLRASPGRARIEGVREEDLGEPGFPLLREALMEPTTPEAIRQFLRELGTHLHRPVRVVIGGAVALILPGHLSRATQDIDVVDEVPAEVRAERAVLDNLARRYLLYLTHFQSHFLPAGWQERVHTLEPFGRLSVSLVDPLDVFLSKLFSKRTKDLDDLRVLLPQFDRATIVRRLREDCASLLADVYLRPAAERNWYILTGETLRATE